MSVIPYSSRGFTIVELLVVIVTIGILAGIVIVMYSGVQQASRESRVSEQLAQSRKKMELERVSTGKWPFEDAVRNEIVTNGIADGKICEKISNYLINDKILSGSRPDESASTSCSNVNSLGQTINGVTPGGELIFCVMVPVATNISTPAYYIITSQQMGVKKFVTYSDLSVCNP